METDSREYDILANALIDIKNIDGLTCEIGVREGGSTKLILDHLKTTGQKKMHVAIDPFGNIDYTHHNTRTEKMDYTNLMKNRMLHNLYNYVYLHDMDLIFLPLEDTEFFSRYADGVPIYNEVKQIVNTYALVFLDGPHSTIHVKREFDFFKDKIPSGGYIVFDDIDQYPHMAELDRYIQSNGFKIVEQRVCKVSYKRAVPPALG